MLNQYRLMVLEFLEKELILYTKNISKQIRYIKSEIDVLNQVKTNDN